MLIFDPQMQSQLFRSFSGNLLPFGGEAILYPELFSKPESDELYTQLQQQTAWTQEPIKIFGRLVMQPRLTACYGEKAVAYSGITMQIYPWTALLLDVKQRVEQIAGVAFNSVLLNYYRDGNDSMGWHRDNERELGLQPVIASVSFGAPRVFKLRTYKAHDHPISVPLPHGSLLLMRGDSQHIWEHSLPKSKAGEGRINLTFRQIS